MTPAEFEQEAVFLAELEDYLKGKGDTEGLLLVIKAHAQLQLMIDSDDEPRERDELRVWQKTADIVISELRAEVDTAKAKDEYMMSRLTFYCDLSDELRAEVERLRAALQSIRTYCGERAEAGARGDWEGLCALADGALGHHKECGVVEC
jgi:hypothetical protein